MAFSIFSMMTCMLIGAMNLLVKYHKNKKKMSSLVYKPRLQMNSYGIYMFVFPVIAMALESLESSFLVLMGLLSLYLICFLTIFYISLIKPLIYENGLLLHTHKIEWHHVTGYRYKQNQMTKKFKLEIYIKIFKNDGFSLLDRTYILDKDALDKILLLLNKNNIQMNTESRLCHE